MKKNYELWMYEFMESWKNLDGIKTTSFFAKDVNYYENPIDEPCSCWEEVEALWSVVKNNQSDISYNFDIVSSTNEFCISNWKMNRKLNGTPQLIDGIFMFKLDENGLCDFFKQWRYTKEDIIS